MVTVYPPAIYCSTLNKISSYFHPLLPLVSNSQLQHPHTTPCRESENSCWVSYGLLTLKIQVWYVSTNLQLQLRQRASDIFQSQCDTHKEIIPLWVQLSSADSPLLCSHLTWKYVPFQQKMKINHNSAEKLPFSLWAKSLSAWLLSSLDCLQ